MIHLPWTSLWLGQMPYLEALNYQNERRHEVAQTGRGLILGLEHPSVITLGWRMKNSSILSAIPQVHTDRGGQATLHNPGQLVIYPIMPFRQWNIGVRDYVQLLVQTTENFIRKCNIIIIPKPQGVFSKNGKIASVGLNLKKGISTHGVAINLNNDLTEFAGIDPCGVAGQAVDKVGNYLDISLEDAFELWQEEFKALTSRAATH